MPDIGIAELLIIAVITIMWVVPIVLIVLGVRWLLERRGSGVHAAQPMPDTALATLRQRFARGEIDAAEFEERKRTLGG